MWVAVGAGCRGEEEMRWEVADERIRAWKEKVEYTNCFVVLTSLAIAVTFIAFLHHRNSEPQLLHTHKQSITGLRAHYCEGPPEVPRQ
ncbi:hypothetical protein DKX38_002201 [Salix brachista]|uniref:Uncharacterized protein n=1 Tax=Salix brachista TaxID=2182728 RepID=A0A5N5NNC2_9ROSI|nr:hypothetical protein DKX38_002201 [Salix brachista]